MAESSADVGDATGARRRGNEGPFSQPRFLRHAPTDNGHYLNRTRQRHCPREDHGYSLMLPPHLKLRVNVATKHGRHQHGLPSRLSKKGERQNRKRHSLNELAAGILLMCRHYE